jgi:ankyrin repeat protein
MVRLLLDAGADIDATDAHNETPLFGAAARGDRDMVRLLIERGAGFNFGSDAELYHLMARMPAAIFLFVAEHQFAVDRGQRVLDETQQTLLGWAACTGDLEATKKLLALGADPSETDPQGRTALHYAADRGREEIVAELLERGAPTDALDDDGSTPLDALKNSGGWSNNQEYRRKLTRIRQRLEAAEATRP